MSFNYLPNLTAQSVLPCEPWLIEAHKPEFATKAEYRAWCIHPTTDHAFISAVVGAQPSLRVGESNPPSSMVGLILDYDADPGANPAEMILANAPSDLRPAWVARTYSGNCRVIYKFEAAIPLFTPEVAKEFLKRASRELKLRKLLPGFEQEAMLDLSKHYEIGEDWQPVGTGESFLPTSLLLAWISDASRKHKWENEGAAIPMEMLRAEGEKRFPGRWPNGWAAFDVSARGPRFWDAESTDNTSVIVRETGCQFFSDGGGWMTWEAIFGTDFVRLWSSNRKGNAIKDIWYDGKHYWRKLKNGEWSYSNRGDLELHLRVHCGLSGKAPKPGQASEVEEALYDVQTINHVKKAMPFVFRPDGQLIYNGKRYLNISTVRPISPVDTEGEWGVGFPWLAEYFEALFDPIDQLDYFLAWLKHFYLGALTRAPQRGLALFIAGPVGAGKTVLNKAILGQLFGGRQDAGRYLIGKDQFNDALFSAAVWNVDDEVSNDDYRQRAVFTQMVKKVIANDSFTYRAMYTGGEDLEWIGRPIITMNDDPESLQMLPETERNILDKVNILKVKKPGMSTWPTDKEIAAELPYLAAFLRDWSYPAHTLPPTGDVRFGVVSYKHADLLRSASSTGTASSFEELLQLWRAAWFAPSGAGEHDQTWEGNPTALCQAIGRNETLKQILDRNFSNTNGMSTQLNKLVHRKASYITRTSDRHYVIHRHNQG